MAKLDFTAEELTNVLNQYIANPSASVFQGPIIGPRRQWVQFATDNIQPPTALYIAPEDNIRVSVWTPTGGLHLNITGRFINDDLQIVPFRHVIYPTGAATRETFIIDIPECLLLALEVDAEDVSIEAGEMYVNVDVIRGAGADLVTFGNLIQSPVTNLFHPTWPWSQHKFTTDAPAHFRFTQIAGGSPPANWTLTFTDFVRTRVLSVEFTIATDATAADRRPHLSYQLNGAIEIANIGPQVAQTASLSWTYSYFIGASTVDAASGRRQHVGLPPIWLPRQSSLQLQVGSLAAGDTLSTSVVTYEQYIDTSS